MESDRFFVDNTAPIITGPEAEASADGARIRASAKDPGSNIARAEYCVDAGEWKLVEPIGRLSDAESENYDFPLHGLSGRTHNRDSCLRSLRQCLRRENSFSRRGCVALKERGMHNAVTNLFNRTWK